MSKEIFCKLSTKFEEVNDEKNYEDMGVIDGKYVNVYIHTGGYDVSDYFDGCIQIFLEDPSTAIMGDLDSDGDVDGEDLKIFSQFYGTEPLTP